MEKLSEFEQRLAITHVTNELILALQQGTDMPWPSQTSDVLQPFVADVLWGRPIRGMGQAFVDCTLESFCRFCDAYARFKLDLARAEIKDPLPPCSTLWMFLSDDYKALYFRAVAHRLSETRRLAGDIPPLLSPPSIKAFIAQVTRAPESLTSAAEAPAASSQSGDASTSSIQASTAGPSSGINVASPLSRRRTAAVSTCPCQTQWLDFLRSIADNAATSG